METQKQLLEVDEDAEGYDDGADFEEEEVGGSRQLQRKIRVEVPRRKGPDGGTEQCALAGYVWPL